MKNFAYSEESRVISKELMHDLNTRAITSLLYNESPISRSEIAKSTSLAPATVSNITSRLISSGLVKETGAGKSTGGRKPTLLDIDRTFGYVVAVKIEARKVITGLYDLRTNKLDGNSATFSPEPNYRTILDIIFRAVKSYDDQKEIIGVGIGVSGLITDEGEIIYSPILNWEDLPLAEDLYTELSLPIIVDNDVNALTLAEGWIGAGKDFDNFLCVTVGEGIGAGLMIDGSLYRGAIGGAGEIGHVTVDPDGPRCRCGERGCLEALASDYFLRNEIVKHDFNPLTINHLISLAETGDPKALDIFRRMGHSLGLGIKNLVNTLNPEAVILGGERLSEADYFMSEMEEEVLNHSFPQEAKKLKILRAKLGKEGWLIGPASLSIRNFFSLPLHHKVKEETEGERTRLTG